MDDKAGVTLALAVLETVLRFPVRLKGDLILHFVLEDETTGNGTLLCLEAGYGADAALIVDGTRPEKAVHQHAGNLQFGIALRGRPASVSVSHMGTNAAEMMARLVLELRDAVFALNSTRVDPWTRFPSPFQLSLQRFQSEGAQLTVPETATAGCYVTFPPPWTLDRMRDLLSSKKAAFARAQSLPEPAELDWSGFATEPVSSDTSALEPVLQQCARDLGMKPIDVGPSTGTSDLRHFARAGTPCLLYGPGSGFNPHRADEHYRLEDLPMMILFYLDLAERWCGVSA